MKLEVGICLLAAIPMLFVPAWGEEPDDPCARAVLAKRTDGADYKPGVDVYGRPVATADLNPTLQLAPPPVIEFPVTLDGLKRLGLDRSGQMEGKIGVATVRIENGRVTINGQDLSGEDPADVIALCRESRKTEKSR